MTNQSSDTSYMRATSPCGLIRLQRSETDSGGCGVRLSWPYGSGHRRAIIGTAPVGSEALNIHNARILTVSNDDIERHNNFTKGSSEKKSIWQLLELDIPMVPAKIVEVENQDRFQYFQHTASKALSIFNHEPTTLGNVLIRLALASDTTSATAVRHSILAFSALHRHGIHAQAFENKIAAINALKTAAGSELSVLEAVQHVATGMLLCSFEIYQASCTSDDWLKYLRGAKSIIRTASLSTFSHHPDIVLLLDWVYYHDVLACFCLRHWYREYGTSPSALLKVTCASPNIGVHLESWVGEPMKRSAQGLELINLLSDLCDAIPRPLCGLSPIETRDRKAFLEILAFRLRSSTPSSKTHTTSATLLHHELYTLALLIYLSRVTRSQLKHTIPILTLTSRAFDILAQLRSCERQFPILIVGIEARTDDQRAAILDLVGRTEGGGVGRSMNHVRLLLQAMWAQDDLAEGKTDYWEKVSYVVSCCTIMPSFV